MTYRISRNKIVRAKVKPRVEARDSLDAAIRNNRTAALLEQETPEIFTTTLGNIPANARLKPEISYVTLLKHRFANNRSTTTLTIPTYIAARYGSPPPGFQSAITSGIPQGLTVVVEVAATEDEQNFSSGTHRITVEREVGRNRSENWHQFAAPGAVNDVQTTLVKLENGSTLLDRDFVLDITTQPEGGLEAPQAWLEIHPSFENHKAVMLTIPLNFMLRNQPVSQDAEIVFVADRSGSMTDKMNSMKSAMNFFLRGIPRGRKFNIWCFGSIHSFLWPESRGYSDQILQAALGFVSRQFEADMGGTELLSALNGIVAARDRSRMTNIVTLTDGEVWKLDETISFVQQTRRETEGSVRFFALGIGNAVSHELVEGIAKAGGGYAEVIPAASQGGWDDRVVAVLHAALASHIGPLRIEFDQDSMEEAQGQQPLDGAAEPTRPGSLQSPADVSALSPFLRNRVFMLFDSLTSPPRLDSINIKATTPSGDEIVTQVTVKPLEQRDTAIHRLGARALLGDLERGQSWIQLDPNRPPRNSPEEEELVRREGENLGCKWSLVSKWTSFYAIEEINRNVRDPFLDLDDFHVHEAVGGSDLLHLRGASNQRPHGPIMALLNTGPLQLDSESEEDDDIASASDSAEIEHGGDGDSDDGGYDQGGGGAGGSLGNVGNGEQRGPDPGDGRPRADGEERREDSPNRPNDGSSAGMARNLTATLLVTNSAPGNSGSHSLTSDVTTRRVNYGSSPVPALAHHPGPQLWAFSDRPREVTQRSSALFSYWDLDEPRPDEAPRPSHGKPTSEKPTSGKSTSENPTSGKPTSEKPTSGKSTSEKSTSDLYSSIIHADTRDTSVDDPTRPFRFARRRLGSRFSVSNPDIDLPELSSSPMISAPRFNLPASTALLSDQRHTPKSDQDRYGERVVRNLLAFQSFDGSFKVDSLDQLKDLGHEFAFVVRDLQLEVHLRLALSIAIVVLLEEKFQFCRDLWVLMRDKARAYVDQNLSHGPVKDELYQSTKDELRRVQLPMSKPSADSGSPIVSQSTHMQPAGWIRGLNDISRPKGKENPELEKLGSGSRLTPPVVAVMRGTSRKRVALETAPIDMEHLPYPKNLASTE